MVLLLPWFLTGESVVKLPTLKLHYQLSEKEANALTLKAFIV